jgi:hypothetical protein
LPHHPSIAKLPLHYATKYCLVKNLIMIDLTYMISILNSIFTVVFFTTR